MGLLRRPRVAELVETDDWLAPRAARHSRASQKPDCGCAAIPIHTKARSHPRHTIAAIRENAAEVTADGCERTPGGIVWIASPVALTLLQNVAACACDSPCHGGLG